jgi:hypothetical protein
MIDSTLFGLTSDIEVQFFTPEQAAKTPGAKAGYNAVYKIGKNRVRYELLKAGKAQVSVQSEPKKVKEEKQIEVVVQEVTPVVEEIQTPVVEEVKTEETQEVVAEPVVEVKQSKKK